MNLNAIEVLLVEDNISDAELTIRELKKNNLANNLFHVKDGEEALDFIFATGSYTGVRDKQYQPRIILLDIQMPKVNGIEVLAKIKSNADTASIPVVILTSSNQDPDIRACYALGANSYIVKPVDFESFSQAIKNLGFYWLLLNHPSTEEMLAQQQLMKHHEETVRTNRQLRELSSHLQNRLEEERIQIARDIHDELGQQLTGIKMEVQWLKKTVSTEDEIVKEKITGIIDRIDETVKSVRRISWSLRPGMLDDLGLATTLEWHSEEMARKSGIPIHFHSTIQDAVIPEATATGIFRIYQEVITNAIRHSEASEIRSSLLVRNGELILQIADNGKGMDTKDAVPKKTLGLVGIKERALALGGVYELNSEPGKGVDVTITLPFLQTP